MKTTGQDRRSSSLSTAHGYSIVETLIVVTIIAVLAVVVFNRYERTALEARRTALKSELNNIRQAIVLFRITKGRYPASLYEMVQTRVMMPYADSAQRLFNNTYLEHQAIDEKMNLLDPFGLPFSYDPVSGVVRSAADGYAEW